MIMKRIAAIFLTMIFLLYLGGMQLMYWVRIDTAKHQASALIQNNKANASNTTEFILTPSQYNSLNWSDRNKEFTIEGQRYDITGIEYLSNGVKIICYQDNPETEVVSAFQKFAERLFSSHQQSGNSDNDLISKITKEYLPLKLVVAPQIYERAFSLIISEDIHSPLLFTADIWHPPLSC